MNTYVCKTLSKSGIVEKSFYKAESYDAVVKILESSQKEIIAVRKTYLSFNFKRIHKKTIILFISQLHRYLDANITLDKALGYLLESNQKDKALSQKISLVLKHVNEGNLLSTAFEKLSFISKTELTIIRYGERVGDLTIALKALVDYLSWKNEFSKTLKKSLSYPFILLGVFSFLLAFLGGFVIPEVKSYVLALGQPISLSSHILFVTADCIKEHYVAVLVSIALGSLFITAAIRFSLRLKVLVHKLGLWVPLWGKFIKNTEKLMFFESLKILLSQGVPLNEALLYGSKSMNNIYLRMQIETIAEALSRGNSFSKAYKTLSFSSPVVSGLLDGGERQGDLGMALENITMIYKGDVDQITSHISKVLEPLLLLLFGGLLAWIVYAMLYPIYSSFSTIQGF